MTLIPPKRTVSDTENKLRLLYCVKELEQVRDTQLWPFVASLDLMDYMPMQLLLHELLSGGDLHMGAEALSGLISLSPHGQETLRLFSHRIMPSDRERIAAAAPAYREQLKKRRQIRASYESAREGDYHVLLSLQESEIPILLIRIATPSREYAMQSLQSFEEKASSILLYLYGLDAQGPEMPSPITALPNPLPLLTTLSPREHTITATLSPEGATFELTLLLPDLASAKRFQALLAGKKREDVARRLFSVLCIRESG